MRCQTVLHRLVVRARIVLVAADGWANVDIAYELGMHVDTVSKWRKRLCQEGMPDWPISGVGVGLGSLLPGLWLRSSHGVRGADRPAGGAVAVELRRVGRPGGHRGTGAGGVGVDGAPLAGRRRYQTAAPYRRLQDAEPPTIQEVPS